MGLGLSVWGVSGFRAQASEFADVCVQGFGGLGFKGLKGSGV